MAATAPDAQRLRRLSKFLSKHLRHDPAALGLELQPGGWVPVATLLAACAKAGVRLNAEVLADVVRTNDKQRFAFDETGQRIRANQGHSVDVDLELSPTVPPSQLYHGTSRHNLESIWATGLNKGNRHHVHLSLDPTTAKKVGARQHGVQNSTILLVASADMHAAGHVFYCSANAVWLTDHVSVEFLSIVQ
jgi:putative RNA 2'-phosphotransferase